MEYKQVDQISRPYEYGEGKEFPNKEVAMKQIKHLELQKKTEVAMLRLYDVSKFQIIEEENALFLKIIFEIPCVV